MVSRIDREVESETSADGGADRLDKLGAATLNFKRQVLEAFALDLHGGTLVVLRAFQKRGLGQRSASDLGNGGITLGPEFLAFVELHCLKN